MQWLLCETATAFFGACDPDHVTIRCDLNVTVAMELGLSSLHF
jgi:hypothetical protein